MLKVRAAHAEYNNQIFYLSLSPLELPVVPLYGRPHLPLHQRPRLHQGRGRRLPQAHVAKAAKGWHNQISMIVTKYISYAKTEEGVYV